MPVKVRFAPSPTGLLHVGNARTAILNGLFARSCGGEFILRIDDTDFERSRPEYEQAIYRDLNWLFIGDTWTTVDLQSARSPEYNAARERLITAGYLYPCYESAAELDRRRKRQMAAGRPPVYDRAALSLGAADRAALEAEGRKPHWRFKLSHTKVAWHDLIRGPVEIDTAALSDPVLIREDGRFLYTLPSVVDDIAYGISHIIRGEDHVTNTAAQIEIFGALGAGHPNFAHHPLLVGANGEALSKRLGSLSLASLREDGIEPLALAAYLAKIGTSDAIEPRLSLADLAAEFDFSKIGRAPAHFDAEELAALNAKTLHLLPYAAVAARLEALGIAGGATWWEAIRPNLARLGDAGALLRLVTGPVTPVIGDDAITVAAAALLPPEPWDEATWSVWTKAISSQTGTRGKDLFHPLRLALTGRGDGPELKKLLPLIGRARTLARLKGETA